MRAERVLYAVLDEDLEDLLKSLGQLERLRRGEVTCAVCSAPMSVRNLHAITVLPDGELRWLCHDSECAVVGHACQES